MSIIIIEGCDCAGKSTIAELLSKKTGYKIVKGSSFQISELGGDGMYDHMSKLLDRENIIIDRFYMSNLVYGTLFDYPLMNYLQFDELADKTSKNALMVYVTASEEKIKNRMMARGDDMIKSENVRSILEKYDEVLSSNLGQSLALNINTSNISKEEMPLAVSMILEFSNNVETKMFLKRKL